MASQSLLTEDLSILSVLESLAGAADVPQRQIAANTGLNLAKVNFVLRRLIEKGFVKLNRVRTNPHKLAYWYLLTPEGLAEKSRLTYAFVRRVLGEYTVAEAQLEERLREMTTHGVRRVVLVGANEITEFCLRILAKLEPKLQVLGVVDKSGQHPLTLRLEDVGGLAPDALVVCEAGARGLPTGLPAINLFDKAFFLVGASAPKRKPSRKPRQRKPKGEKSDDQRVQAAD